MKKFINDTIKVHGKYSQKRVLTYLSFFVATIYGFLPIAYDKFDVKEFVFLGFLGIGGFSLFRTQKTNENINSVEAQNFE